MQESIISIAVFLLFFIVLYFKTQKLYSKNQFLLSFFLSLIIPITLFFISDKENQIKFLCFGSIFFFYTVLLFGIKKCYSRLSQFLIDRQLLDGKFSGNSFTHVTTGQYGSYWDKKLGSNPSWLDYLLSASLLFLPIFAIIVFYSLVV